MSSPTAASSSPVMFTCPTKEAPTFTGHRMRPAEFEGVRETRSFRCRDCGEIHSWTPETAWLQGRAAA